MRIADWRTPGDIKAELLNVLVNPAGDDERGPSVVSMPGQVVFASLPAAARGLHCEPGILAGNLLLVAGSSLYQVSSAGVVTSLGTVGGTGHARIAATESGVIVSSAGATAYRANTGTISPVTLPTGDLIADAASLDQRGLYVASGTAQVYWSEVGNPADVRALNTQRAVTRPDHLLAVRVVNRNVYLLGQTSVELWRATGQLSPAFVRVGDLAFDQGVAGRDAACGGDGRLWWLSPDGVVWSMVGQQPQRASTPSMDLEIGATSAANRAAAIMTAWAWGGRQLITLHVPGLGAWTHDIGQELWVRRESPGATGERWAYRAAAYGGVYVGGPGFATLASLSDTTVVDTGFGPQQRRWTIYTPAADVTPVGLALPDMTMVGGAGSVTMDYSQNGGATYVGARSLALPVQLQRQLGAVRRPGRVWRFTAADSARITARGLWLNERALGV